MMRHIGLYCLSLTLLAFAIQACAQPGLDLAKLDREIQAAPMLQADNLPNGIKVTRGPNEYWVPAPDGKTYHLLLRYFNQYHGPHTVILCDLGSGEVTSHNLGNALYSNAMVGPDGKLYGHRSGGKGTVIWTYDPVAKKFSQLEESLPMDGETKPFAVDSEGMIYGSASADGQVYAYQLNPKTGKITHYGKLGPSHAPNGCWAYTMAVDDTHVYIASGKIPWYLVAYERATGKTEVLHTTGTDRFYLSVSNEKGGVVCSITEQGKGSERYWIKNGKMTPIKDPKEAPPWTVPAPAKPLAARPEIAGLEVTPEGHGVLWYRTPEAKVAAPKTIAVAATAESLGWKKLEFKIPMFPVSAQGVMALADGRVYGSAGKYQGNYILDPKTDQITYLGVIPLSEYCAIQEGNKIYMSGYPSGALYEYDLTKPWTSGKAIKPWEKPVDSGTAGANPRRIAYLGNEGSGAHKMWTAAKGADDKLYFGGRWYRNGNGGGLGWLDLKTGKVGGSYQDFSAHMICYLTTAGNGKYIVVSTHPVDDIVLKKPTPKQGELLVWDTATGKVERTIAPVPDAQFAGPIVGVGGNMVMGITYDPSDPKGEKPEEKSSILYTVDVAQGKVVQAVKLPYTVGFLTNENFDRQDGFDLALGPDGMVWTYLGGKMSPMEGGQSWGRVYQNCALVRINPKTGQIQVMGKLDRPGGMAFAGRDLYLTDSKYVPLEKSQYVRRIKNIVPAQP